jgi:hypothetical protein
MPKPLNPMQISRGVFAPAGLILPTAVNVKNVNRPNNFASQVQTALPKAIKPVPTKTQNIIPTLLSLFLRQTKIAQTPPTLQSAPLAFTGLPPMAKLPVDSLFESGNKLPSGNQSSNGFIPRPGNLQNNGQAAQKALGPNLLGKNPATGPTNAATANNLPQTNNNSNANLFTTFLPNSFGGFIAKIPAALNAATQVFKSNVPQPAAATTNLGGIGGSSGNNMVQSVLNNMSTFFRDNPTALAALLSTNPAFLTKLTNATGGLGLLALVDLISNGGRNIVQLFSNTNNSNTSPPVV